MTAIQIHTEENVINVSPVSGTSPIVSNANVMDMHKRVIPERVNVHLVKISQLVTIVIGNELIFLIFKKF